MKRLLPVFLVLVIGLAFIAVAQPAQSQSGNTWRGDFYANPNWSGAPTMTTYTSAVSYNWGTNAPGPNMPADNWTATFTTDAYFYGTSYFFNVVADDEVILYVDGVQQLNTVGKGMSGKSLSVQVNMWEGTHHVQVYYRELTVDAYLYVGWSTCSNCGPPPTPGVTYPPLPANQNPPLITEYGDFTPCMQQNIDQVNCFVPTWNLDAGSIELENQIQSWVVCGPADIEQTYLVNNQAKKYKCSKTLAGWFPE